MSNLNERKKIVLVTFFLSFSIYCICQDSVQKKITWSGYVKDLQSAVFTDKFRSCNYTNLLHNRINFRWKPTEKITGAVEIRNRFFWGSDARNITSSGQSLQNENERINLAVNWYNQANIVLHTNTERLWVEYRRLKWNLRTGRQRLNWSMTNTWNPNDIFNTYNFLDFDYEERPGCDAVKVQYMISDMSNLELAFAVSGKNKNIAAAKYFFNKKGYDLQVISGIYKNNFTCGFGWAGSINDVGFKGETQLFLNKYDSLNFFNVTTELDYILKNGWYINAGLLYNNKGLNSAVGDWTSVDFRISPGNLMPAKWNILISTSKEFTPIFNGSLAIIYSPGMNMMILFPSLKYNLFSNLDLDLIWQSFFSELENKFRDAAHTAFVRVRWSF